MTRPIGSCLTRAASIGRHLLFLTESDVPDGQASWTSRRLRRGSLLAALGGAVLFAGSLHHAGTTAVVGLFRRVGSRHTVGVRVGGARGLGRTAACGVLLD